MAKFSFDSSAVAPQAPMGIVPVGKYLAHITESDLVDLSSGNGQRLKLTFEIIDGQFKGRRVWESLNVVHTNEQAQGIAQSQLSSICRAVGVNKLEETAILHFKPLLITVGIQEAKGEYKERNTIKGYDSASEGKAPAVAPASSAPTSGKAVPAWAKKAA